MVSHQLLDYVRMLQNVISVNQFHQGAQSVHSTNTPSAVKAKVYLLGVQTRNPGVG